MRNKLRRKWQVQYVVGCRRYSVSSHSDYESADRVIDATSRSDGQVIDEIVDWLRNKKLDGRRASA